MSPSLSLPLPLSLSLTVSLGFSMMVAVGPFTTSDNLDMRPLHDLMAIVREERPSVLVLVGPVRTHTHTRTHARTHMHARTHARTHTCTHACTTHTQPYK